MTPQDIVNALEAIEAVEEAELRKNSEGEKGSGFFLSREIQRIDYLVIEGDVMKYKFFNILVKGMDAKYLDSVPDILKPPEFSRDPIFAEGDIKQRYRAIDSQKANQKIVSVRTTLQDDGDIVSMKVLENDKIVSKRYMAYFDNGKKEFKEMA